MKKIEKNLFFIDAESDGLYGDFISVGIIVTDSMCEEIERYYFGIDPQQLEVSDEWTKKHVIPVLGDYEKCANQEILLRRVWECWQKHSNNAYAIGDVIFPVEARLFQECVLLDRKKNCFNGPFPLLDLSSFLLDKGLDPLAEREKLVPIEANRGKQHNALHDVEVAIQIYKTYILEG